MFRSILSLSKIAHQMRRDLLFSQRNRTAERIVGVGFGGDREVGEGGRQYRGSSKNRGVSTTLSTM